MRYQRQKGKPKGVKGVIIRCELIQRSKAKIRSTREWRDVNKIPSSKKGRESLHTPSRSDERAYGYLISSKSTTKDKRNVEWSRVGKRWLKSFFVGRDESSGELKSFFVGPDDSESNDDYSVISISVVSSTASSAVPSVEGAAGFSKDSS